MPPVNRMTDRCKKNYQTLGGKNITSLKSKMFLISAHDHFSSVYIVPFKHYRNIDVILIFSLYEQTFNC